MKTFKKEDNCYRDVITFIADKDGVFIRQTTLELIDDEWEYKTGTTIQLTVEEKAELIKYLQREAVYDQDI